MTTIMNVELELFGPLAGATKTINGHHFSNGICRLEGQPENLSGAIKYLRLYQAYPVGSEEYRAAKERTSGEHNPEANSQHGSPVQVQRELQPNGAGATAQAPADVGAADESAAGNPGVLPAGDGQEDAGLPSEPAPPEVTNEKLAGVIRALDPDNPSHWTKQGRPSMAAIEEAYGSTDITRRDVSAAVPGWDRETAAREQQDLKDLGIGTDSQEQIAEEGARD